MVTEGAVLLAIQNLKQCRRRVAVIGNTKLIHLVQKHQRIDGACLLHGIDDASVNCADIGLSVSADFRFILHAAQGHPHIVTVECLRNGTRD